MNKQKTEKKLTFHNIRGELGQSDMIALKQVHQKWLDQKSNIQL